MENKEQKKPIYKKIEANKLRKLFNRDAQLLRVKNHIREAWRILKEVEEVK